MALAARLTFRDSRGCLCIRRREREHRERQQNQCRRADESTYNRKFDRFRISHCRSPVYSNILHKACPSRTDHNRMAAPSNIRITGVHASRAAGGVTGSSEITPKPDISLRCDNRHFGSNANGLGALRPLRECPKKAEIVLRCNILRNGPETLVSAVCGRNHCSFTRGRGDAARQKGPDMLNVLCKC